MVKRRAITGVVGLILFASCGSTVPDATRGQALFRGEANLGDPNVPTCVSCHAIEPGEPADIGTNLSNIGNRASTMVAGQSPEAYLRSSIVDPDAYLAGGFQEGIMYRRYADVLTSAQIDDLVAYLLTLQSGVDE